MSTLNESTFSIEDAINKQQKARQYVKQGRYEKAVPLLEECLHIKQELVNVPPYVCPTDIIYLHMEIGDVCQRFCTSTDQAMRHFRTAWSLCHVQYGSNHPLTQDAQQKFLVTARTSSSRISAANAAAA